MAERLAQFTVGRCLLHLNQTNCKKKDLIWLSRFELSVRTRQIAMDAFLLK